MSGCSHLIIFLSLAILCTKSISQRQCRPHVLLLLLLLGPKGAAIVLLSGSWYKSLKLPVDEKMTRAPWPSAPPERCQLLGDLGFPRLTLTNADAVRLSPRGVAFVELGLARDANSSCVLTPPARVVDGGDADAPATVGAPLPFPRVVGFLCFDPAAIRPLAVGSHSHRSLEYLAPCTTTCSRSCRVRVALGLSFLFARIMHGCNFGFGAVLGSGAFRTCQFCSLRDFGTQDVPPSDAPPLLLHGVFSLLMGSICDAAVPFTRSCRGKKYDTCRRFRVQLG